VVCRALIKEQARKELEREQQTEAEIEKLKSVYGEKEPEVNEAPEQAGYPRRHKLVKDRAQCCGYGSVGSVCFLGLLYPDPLVRGTDPDPSIIKQK
jgi:hypothetical protein